MTRISDEEGRTNGPQRPEPEALRKGETVSAFPNKDFFVLMLTRDIELQDAILDLLDNCVDGVVRTLGGQLEGERPYEGFHAHIEMTPERFAIRDNCGGIPLDLARKKAFALGRSPREHDMLATVGMYGIGMKRAIFKLGRSARVHSHHGGIGFAVTVSPQWLDDPKNWDLPIEAEEDGIVSNGTYIEVTELREEATRRFDLDTDAFINDFKQYVSQHYAIIIGKGFDVFVNGTPIEPRPFRLLTVGRDEIAARGVLAPYIFRAEVDGVSIELYAGLYRQIPDQIEEEEDLETRGSRDDAGWTIVCNDRVVVYRDKTRLTGWGEATVPSYHNQFIAITGIVFMKSDNPWALPLTSTKRGIDASSEIYLRTKEYMRDATRHFTSFTNRWKKYPRDLERIYRGAEAVGVGELRAMSGVAPMNPVRKLEGARRYSPSLPLPPPAEKSEVRISFFEPKNEVQRVSRFLFEDEEQPPDQVGRACFDRVLKEVTE